MPLPKKILDALSKYRALFILSAAGIAGSGYLLNQISAIESFDRQSKNGVCRSEGSLRSFATTCSIDIEKITYLTMSSKHIAYFGPTPSGELDNLELTVTGLKTLKGQDLNKKSLVFSISHTDGSVSEISLP